MKNQSSEAIANYILNLVEVKLLIGSLDKEKIVKDISLKLKEFFDAEINSAIAIVKQKEAQWGETAVRVNLITKEIISNIEQLK